MDADATRALVCTTDEIDEQYPDEFPQSSERFRASQILRCCERRTDRYLSYRQGAVRSGAAIRADTQRKYPYPIWRVEILCLELPYEAFLR